MAIIGRAVTERLRRRLRLVEGRLGLREPTWAQFASFFAPWVASLCGLLDREGLDVLRALLEAMRDGECGYDGPETYSGVTRWLFGQVVALIDKAERGGFRRETERLWQLALIDQLQQRSEAEWRQWRNEHDFA